ncbi:MAG: DHH family phosphoesterase, partial [Bacteroidales bacterium]
FFTERENRIRISLRSKGDIDVNIFARENFNGGGHKNAAGGNSYESLEDTLLRFNALLPAFHAGFKSKR